VRFGWGEPFDAFLFLLVAFDQVAKFFSQAREHSATRNPHSARFHVELVGDISSRSAFNGDFPKGVPGAFFEVALD